MRLCACVSRWSGVIFCHGPFLLGHRRGSGSMSHEGPQLPTLVKGRRLRAAIIGLSQSPGLLKELERSSLEIVAVADFDLRPAVMEDLRKKGISVSQDYTEVLDRRDLDLILNLIPDQTVEAIIHQLKPEGAEVVHSSAASFLRSFSQGHVVRKGLMGILDEVSRFMAGLLDHGTFTERLLRRAMELTDLQGAGVWLKDAQHFAAVRCVDLPVSLLDWGPRMGSGSPFDRLMEERGILTIMDVGSATDHEIARALLDSGFQALTMVPVSRGGEVQGALLLFGSGPSNLPKDLTPILCSVAEILVHVSRRHRGQRAAGEAMIRDELTGLYNTEHFMEKLEAEIRRANRSEHPFSVLYLHTGAVSGVDCLDNWVDRSFAETVARELMASVREVDVPARYRGRDFTLILPHTSSSGALTAARRILQRVLTPRAQGMSTPQARISIGVAFYPEHGVRPMELVENAEVAAMLAAREGGDRIRLFRVGKAGPEDATPEAIIQDYPMLSDLFHLLEIQGLKDRRTYIHAREVAHYARIIGRELGLGSEELKEVELAGWLHDVGKMTVPTLNGEPGVDLSRLSAISRRIHPAVGTYLLKGVIGSSPAVNAVLYHHARFDGSGGSLGPRGEEIPLEARIIAVADAYQNLRQALQGTNRPSQRELFNRLRKRAGGELDPMLVECLIRGVAGE